MRWKILNNGREVVGNIPTKGRYAKELPERQIRQILGIPYSVCLHAKNCDLQDLPHTDQAIEWYRITSCNYETDRSLCWAILERQEG